MSSRRSGRRLGSAASTSSVVRVPDDRPDVVEIAFSVVPVSGDDPLAIALEVVL